MGDWADTGMSDVPSDSQNTDQCDVCQISDSQVLNSGERPGMVGYGTGTVDGVSIITCDRRGCDQCVGEKGPTTCCPVTEDGEDPGMGGGWTDNDAEWVGTMRLRQTCESRGTCQTVDSTVTGDGEDLGMVESHSLTELSGDEESEVRFWARKLARTDFGILKVCKVVMDENEKLLSEMSPKSRMKENVQWGEI